MALDNAKNFAKSTVSTGYDSLATSIVLSPGGGAKFPTPPFNATWWNITDYSDPADDPNVEIVRVTAINNDTLTIVRGQEGTSANNHNTPNKVYVLIAGLTSKVINTDIPATFVQSGGVSGGQTIIGGTGTSDVLKLQGTSGNGTLTNPAIQALVGNNGATNALTILNNGNVGIGTANPGNNLVVVANGANKGIDVLPSGYPSGGTMRIANPGVDNTLQIGAVENNNVQFLSNNAVGMTLTTAGNVGIGTTSPNYKLHVVDNKGNDRSRIYIGNSGTPSLSTALSLNGKWQVMNDIIANGGQNFAIMDLVSQSYRFYIDSVGNVGIGTITPQQPLTLSSGYTFAIEMAIPTGVSSSTAASGTLNGTYYYKVSASDGTGWTKLSSEVSQTVDGGTTAGTINVSWTAVTGATKYRVWRGTSAGGENQYYETTTTSISDNGSLTFTSGTVPTVTTAYVDKITSSGSSWLLGGSVGIGTASPVSPLHIVQGGTGYLVPVTIENTGDPGTGATRLNVKNLVSSIMLQASGSTASGVLANAPAIVAMTGSNMVLGANTGMGIDLFVNNNYNNPQFILDSGGNFNFNTGQVYIQQSSGNVGIATTNPGSRLDIRHNITGYTNLVNIQNTVDPGTGATGLQISNPVSTLLFRAYGSTAPGILASAAGILGTVGSSFIIGGGTSMPTYIYSYNNYSTPEFTIKNGSVGINTTTPSYKFHVNGILGFTPGNSVTPINNGDVVIEATSNTQLTFKLKGSDGTIRTATLTLA